MVWILLSKGTVLLSLLSCHCKFLHINRILRHGLFLWLVTTWCRVWGRFPSLGFIFLPLLTPMINLVNTIAQYDPNIRNWRSLLSPSILSLLFRPPLHLHSQQSPRRSKCIILPPLSPCLPPRDRLPLQHRGPTIEHKYRLNSEKQQLANSPKEPHNMAVPQRIPLLIPDGFEKLVYPNGCIDGKPFMCQSLKLDGTRAWGENRPETLNTHLGGGWGIDSMTLGDDENSPPRFTCLRSGKTRCRSP